MNSCVVVICARGDPVPVDLQLNNLAHLVHSLIVVSGCKMSGETAGKVSKILLEITAASL